MTTNLNKITEVLARGGLVVMPSDTVYGIFVSALNQRAVEKLHSVRERDQKRGFIILVDSIETIVQLVQVSDNIQKRLLTIWRGDSPTSVILSADSLKEMWLADTRGPKPTICFRVPSDEKLKKLLKNTGPLCAPSANLSGKPPAQNIAEAKAYFGDVVDLYVDWGGERNNTMPSRIVTFDDESRIKVVRSDGLSHPEDLVITRRRKLYKFARFDEYPNCFHLEKWKKFLAKFDLTKDRDVVVEVGAGSALFLVELARRHTKKTFIAVDIKSDRLYQGAREAERLNLKNIYFVRSDIAKITEVIPSHSAKEIWLTFPDPWPPKSDARHRLTAPRYLSYYRQIIAEESGVLHLKTDNSPLFEWSLEQFKVNHWKTKFITRDLHNSDSPPEAKIMTSYEKRFTTDGLEINYAQFC
jgi:tRNA (guanine-N7-)-methyltransferase